MPADDAVQRRRQALRAGHRAEAEVDRRLTAVGWQVLDRNWTVPGGELDLVAVLNGKLRFVEVRARSSDDDVPVEETITAAKQRRLRHAATSWLQEHGDDWSEIAFLVALVDMGREPWRITWVDDAF